MKTLSVIKLLKDKENWYVDSEFKDHGILSIVHRPSRYRYYFGTSCVVLHGNDISINSGLFGFIPIWFYSYMLERYLRRTNQLSVIGDNISGN